MLSRRSALSLLAGDFLCLSAFVLLGMQNHGTLAGHSAFWRFIVFAGPLLLAWTVAAAGLDALQFAPPLRWRIIVGRTLAAWLIAAPAALFARALLLGAGSVVVAFALVTLAVGGGLLLAWRGVFLWLAYGRLRA